MSQHPWPLESPPESDEASLSPRTSLLSPPPFDDDGLPDSLRSRRGPGLKFRHERERVHSTASSRDLMHMLVNEEYESKQMRKILYNAFERLEHETKRADAAETRIEDTIQRAKAINEARVAAQHQAVRAQEELKLYKLQLNNAQNEIIRAQDVLKAIEAQRDEAEAAAVSARSKARRLNEERLIEMAREEGRRLGFEEGVRRGRRMGYREVHASAVEERTDEMREVATAVVDRLLEDRDEPEQIEVVDAPTPIPPPPPGARSAPDVHRLGTAVNSSLENQRHSARSRRDSSDSDSRSTLRRVPDPIVPPPPTIVEPRSFTASAPSASSHASRPHSQPWAGPPSTEPFFSRPSSIQNSPPSLRHNIPPDNYIPTADSPHNISLPPPHELQRNIPSPTPSQRTLGAASERGRRPDYMYDNYPPRRGSPDGSLASTKQSVASTISQLEIVGLPTGGRQRDRAQNLSVIHEDASMRSERMSDYSTPQTGRHSFQEMKSNDTLRRDRRSNQRLADELRYSDPSEAEQWRQQAEGSRSQRRREDVTPVLRPAQITVPEPLSPPRVLQQPDSRRRRTASERQGRRETRSEYSGTDQRRPLSSDSSVPEINVEPPSGPPSDAPSRGRGNIPTSGFLSPDHANLPLPPPSTSLGSSSGGGGGGGGGGHRGPPIIPGSQTPRGSIYGSLPDRPPSPGFPPSSYADGSSQPSQGPPVIPRNIGSGGGGRPPSVPYGPPSSERSRSPISFYAASPVPAGVTYPAPPVSRSASLNGYPYPPGAAGSNPSVTSEGRRRRDSLSAATASSSRTKPVMMTGSSATDGSGGVGGGGGASGRDSRASRRPSNASLGSSQQPPSLSRGSYGRYNPSVYNDPAYLASNGSLAESDAGGAGGGETIRHVRIRGSPGYSYADG